MGRADNRLPETTQGLGVVVDDQALFFPTKLLQSPVEVEVAGRKLGVALGELDRVPAAVFTDDDARPFQLFCRWYGFAYTYPGCEIFAG
jgi:hypothetical protein